MFFKLVLISISFVWKLSTVAAWNIPIPGANHDSSQAINGMAVEILSKCYADMREVVIHGDSDKSAIIFLRESEILATLIYNDASLVDDPVKLRMHHNSFVMTSHSVAQLQKMLVTFKQSARWNVMAPFVIIDNSYKNCKNAKGILKLAWKFDLVKSFFLCVDSDGQSMVYTYNPYTSRAPQPWKQVSKPTKQSPRWTMYARRYNQRNICDSLDFDRTKHLDGSTIKIAADLEELGTLIPDKNYNETIIAQMWTEDVYHIERLKYCLNITPIFNIGQGSKLFDYIEDGSCDLSLQYVIPDVSDITHPVLYDDYYIVTNNRGFYTPLEKIANYYGMVTLISMCVILPMTFVVILLSEKTRRWSFAGYEILRLLINAALHSRMDTIVLRIFFSMIFLYFLIMHATFQGHLSAFLTKQEYRKNAETLMDLRDSRYDAIHVYRTVQSLIKDPILREKLVPGETQNCISKIIGNESAVCITTRNYYLERAFKYHLHVSKLPVFRVTDYHEIRNNWPLRERYNLFLMWLESSGQLAKDWRRRDDERIMAKQKRIEAKTAIPEKRPISLKMLEWAFIFLIIGLKVALMSFTVERRVRNQASLQRLNREAARRNIENRRRQIINEIISNPRFEPDTRPRSV